MTDTVKIAIQGDAKGLSAAAKAGAKDLDGLGNKAKKTGRDLTGMGQETDEAGRKIGKLGTASDRAGQQVARLGRASESLRTTGRIIGTASSGIAGKVSAIVGGAGIVMASKQAMEFSDQLTQMGIAARDAKGQIGGKGFAEWFTSTKGLLLDASIATGQGVDDMAAGMRAIVQRTGNMSQATEQIALLGQAATASGSSVEDLGAVASNLDQKVGIKGVNQMREALTLLITQGKTGAFELKDVVSQGERLFTAMPNFKVNGIEGLKSFGAFLQMSRTFNGNAETSAESIVSLGTAIAKLDTKKLAHAGIRGLATTNKDGSKKSTEDVIKDIITRTKGDMDKLIKANVFDEPAQRLVQGMANLYAKGEGFKLFDSFKAAGGSLKDSNMLMEDFSTRMQDAKMQTTVFMSTLRKFADSSLATPLKGFTGALSWLNEHGPMTEAVLKSLAVSLAGVALAVGAVKGVQLFRDVKGLFPGRGGASPLGGVASSLSGGSPVFVTNWPLGGGAGGWQKYGSPSVGGPTGPGGLARASAGLGRFSKADLGMMGLTFVGATAENLALNSGSDAVWGQAGVVLGMGLGAFLGGPAGAMIGSQIGQMAGVAMSGYLKTAEAEAATQHANRKYRDARVVFDSGDNETRKGTSWRSQQFISEDATSKRMSAFMDNTDPAFRAAKKSDVVEVPKSFFEGMAVKDEKGKAIIQLNITNQVDPQGRTTTSVSGPGASNVQVAASTLGPVWVRK